MPLTCMYAIILSPIYSIILRLGTYFHISKNIHDTSVFANERTFHVELSSTNHSSTPSSSSSSSENLSAFGM